MSEKYGPPTSELFKRREPAPEVAAFLEQQPEADWYTCLDFIIDYIPQEQNGIIEWLLEGGAAVKLLCPERSAQPLDLDIISRNLRLQADMVNTGKFDIKNPPVIGCINHEG